MKTQTVIEIRSAEGGQDSKLLVGEMAAVYKKAASVNSFTITKTETKEGFTSIWILEPKSFEFFKGESGCHRWIRIPPTEKYGRTQTSIVTVAVFQSGLKKEVCLDLKDVKVHFTKGSGNGGQKKNKTENVCVLTHLPTGIIVRVEDTRHKSKNEAIAWERLKERLQQIEDHRQADIFQKDIKNQVGNGQRSDKRRTYRVKEDLVVDHISNKTITFRELQKGKLDLLR